MTEQNTEGRIGEGSGLTSSSLRRERPDTMMPLESSRKPRRSLSPVRGADRSRRPPGNVRHLEDAVSRKVAQDQQEQGSTSLTAATNVDRGRRRGMVDNHRRRADQDQASPPPRGTLSRASKSVSPLRSPQPQPPKRVQSMRISGGRDLNDLEDAVSRKIAAEDNLRNSSRSSRGPPSRHGSRGNVSSTMPSRPVRTSSSQSTQVRNGREMVGLEEDIQRKIAEHDNARKAARPRRLRSSRGREMLDLEDHVQRKIAGENQQRYSHQKGRRGQERMTHAPEDGLTQLQMDFDRYQESTTQLSGNEQYEKARAGQSRLDRQHSQAARQQSQQRRIDTTEDEVRSKGNVTSNERSGGVQSRGIQRVVDEQPGFDDDSSVSPFEPVLLPTYARRVSKDGMEVEVGAMAPGAYRAAGLYSSSDDDDYSITSDTPSEAYLRMSESEREMYDAAEAAPHRNRYFSDCGHTASIQTYETRDEGQEVVTRESAELEHSFAMDHSLPSADDLKDGTKSRRCLVLVFIVVVLLFVSLAVGLAKGLGGSGGEVNLKYAEATDKASCIYNLKLEQQCAENEKVVEIPACVEVRYYVIEAELDVYTGTAIDSCSPESFAVLNMASMDQELSISNYVLNTLFFATGGSQRWKERDGWITADCVCSWYGISCRGTAAESAISCPGDPDQVREINLHGNALVGPIPTTLGLLSTLETLYLSANQLTGMIPEELSDLEELIQLDLSENNELGGTVPESITKLTDLIELVLHASALTGTIPPTIHHLESLQHLDLRSNELSGSLPTELGQMASLEFLRLSFNRLTGAIPVQIGNTATLTTLDLYDNQLTSVIPSVVNLLTNLEYISVGFNLYSSQPFPNVTNLSNLEQLILWQSALTGTLPTEIGLLTRLREVNLGENHLSGTIPTQIDGCQDLQLLVLTRCNFESTLPPQLGNLTELTALDIIANKFTGKIPTELGQATSLGHLTFAKNRFTGVIPQEICNLWSFDLETLGDLRGEQCDSEEAPYGGATCPNSECCPDCYFL